MIISKSWLVVVHMWNFVSTFLYDKLSQEEKIPFMSFVTKFLLGFELLIEYKIK